MITHWIAGGGGLRLHVDETGNRDGKPIVFIHGFSQCRLAWKKQMTSDLADDFRLIAIDIRGHGLSDKPRNAYDDSDLWAQDLDAVFTTLGLEQAVLVGWSYGGIIMSDYLGAFGDARLAGTQWVGAVSRLGDPLVQAGFLGHEFLSLIPGLFAENATDSASTLEQFIRLCVHDELTAEDLYFFLGYNTIVPAHVRQALFARTLDHDNRIRSTRKPMSLVYGEADQIVSPRMCTHLERLAPHASVATYPQAGHMPFWEAPDRFNRELREFRARV
jgi:non-heme chloroperoxidase